MSELRQFEWETTGGPRERNAGRRQQLRAFFVLLTLAVLVAVMVGALAPAQAVHAYVLVAVAVAAVVATVDTLSRFGHVERAPRLRPRRRVAAQAQPPPFLEQTKRRLDLAGTTVAQFERLRPRLREIAEQRLAGRGLRPASQTARRLLGEEDWLLLEGPLQSDRFAPGPQQAELRRLVEALERI